MGAVTVIMLPLLLLLTIVSADTAVTPHWVKVCDTSLLFSEDKKNWEDARGECELYGGRLAEIRSMELNYCILNYAQTKGLPIDRYWHSGNDIDREGVYSFNRAKDFTHLDLILWSPVRDFGYGGKSENCLLVYLSSDERAGPWADDACTFGHRYVCQRGL